jgi:hypothetical protein
MPSFTRRKFILVSAAAAIVRDAPSAARGKAWPQPWRELTRVERPRVLFAARQYLREGPKTITSAQASRSAGGPHDYFSEGDYWWPNRDDPNGPYIRHDGESNSSNFVAHRELLLRFSVQMPALGYIRLFAEPRGQDDRCRFHCSFVDRTGAADWG